MNGYQILSNTLKSHIDFVYENRTFRSGVLVDLAISRRKELGVKEARYQFRHAEDDTLSVDLHDCVKHSDRESELVVAIEVVPDEVNENQAVCYFVRLAVSNSERTGTTVHYADGESLKIDHTPAAMERAAKDIAKYVVGEFNSVLLGADRPEQLWVEQRSALQL